MPTDPRTLASWAEVARAALGGAHAGSLLTGPRPATLTTVTLSDGALGAPLVWLDEHSPTATRLAGRDASTLAVACPAPGWVVHLTGRLRPECDDPAPSWCGCRGFRLVPDTVRLVGSARVQVPLPAFHAVPVAAAAGADPEALLHHLVCSHEQELLAAVRSRGHLAEAVVPTAVDHDLVEVVALAPDGVTRLSLPGLPATPGSTAAR